MSKRKFSSTWYVASTIVIAVILVVSFSFFFVLETIDELFIEEVSTSNDEILLATSTSLETTLNEQINIVKGVELAHHNLGVVGSLLNEEYYETILSQNEYITSLEIVGLDGVIMYSSREGENRVGISLITHDLFQDVTGIHQVHIGDLIYDTASENLALEFIYSGEDVVVFSRISIECFHDYGDNFRESFDNKEVMILDGNGIYLYDSKNDYHLLRTRFVMLDDVIELSESRKHVTEIDGEESIVSYNTLNVNDWSVIIYENAESSLSLNRSILTYFIVSTISISLVLTAIYLVFNVLYKRTLERLVLKFKQIKKRDFELVEKESMFKEIDDIRVGYNEMVTDIEYYINRLQNLAYYDGLTGIPSKLKAQDDFDTHKSEFNENTAFIYIDIVRFRVINDNYGYDVGDDLLIQIANIFNQEFDRAYRVEGDEFFAINDMGPGLDFDELSQRIEEQLFNNISILGTSYNFRLKYGVSIFGKDGETFEILFKKAVIAAESVRDNVVGVYRFYDSSYADLYERTAKIELNIREALDKNEFTTVYQPIVDAKTKEIRGFEALSRWNNDLLGFVSPDEFIPVLENRKEVFRLDFSVLNNALRMSKFLQNEYDVHLVASVNISVETLMRDNFVSIVEESLKKFDMNPTMLELEITESTIIVDFEEVSSKMKYLRAIGVKFSEDDFGDSYSSLTYLSRLKIDTLKISKNFLSSMLSNVESRVLVQTVLELSKKLGFYTIVEGVEDEEIYQLFKKYGCDFVQGYLFYRPMSDSNLIDLFKDVEKGDVEDEK